MPAKGPASGTSTPYKTENESLVLGLESLFALHGTIVSTLPPQSQPAFLASVQVKARDKQTTFMLVYRHFS
jgi:hypothetical protein